MNTGGCHGTNAVFFYAGCLSKHMCEVVLGPDVKNGLLLSTARERMNCCRGQLGMNFSVSSKINGHWPCEHQHLEEESPLAAGRWSGSSESPGHGKSPGLGDSSDLGPVLPAPRSPKPKGICVSRCSVVDPLDSEDRMSSTGLELYTLCHTSLTPPL